MPKSSAEQHEELATRIEKGRDASAIAAMVRSAIDEQMIMACQQLISLYRAGSVDHDLVIGKIGEMAGLQNLLATLETRQKQGIAAMERIVDV